MKGLRQLKEAEIGYERERESEESNLKVYFRKSQEKELQQKREKDTAIN